jgi:UDP-GlcNAc:undecaprenyl-phosphate GlcNAc-1-phosphate transferase
MSSAPSYILSWAVPLVAAAALTPAAARVARRLGMLDRPSPAKAHREPTPYLGGLAVAAPVMLVGVAGGAASVQLLVIVAGGAVLAVWGLVDDWRTVAPTAKLVVEVALGVALWFARVRAGLFGVPALDLALTVMWVVAVVNAVNLLDNMDGLAAGVAAIAALAFAAVGASRGDYMIASFAFAVSGGCLGFLVHNFPPAKVFLGDSGTLMLGFLLASLGLKLDMVGQSGFVRSAVPALILCVPMLDTAFVFIRRIREGRPVYSGGTDHSSHLLAGRGLTPRAVALVNYGAAAAGSALAFALLGVSGLARLAVFLGCAVLFLAIVLALVREAAIGPQGRLPAVRSLPQTLGRQVRVVVESSDGSAR